MDYEYIKRNICTDTCFPHGENKCHDICISHNPLTIEELRFLSDVKTHTLELYNSNYAIGVEGCKALASNTTLHTLILQECKINDMGVKLLASNTTLHTIDLYANNIGVEGCKALALNKTLHSLNLNMNNIGNEGAKAFALNTSLNNLRIANYGIDFSCFKKSRFSHLECPDSNIRGIVHKNYLQYMDTIKKIIPLIDDLTNIIIQKL